MREAFNACREAPVTSHISLTFCRIVYPEGNMIFLPGFMCLYEFTGGDSDVFRSDILTLFIGGGHEKMGRLIDAPPRSTHALLP